MQFLERSWVNVAIRATLEKKEDLPSLSQQKLREDGWMDDACCR